MSERESVKFRGQSGHAAHDQPFSEVPDSGIPQVSKIRRAPESFSIVNVSVYGTPNRRHTFGRGTFFFAWCACSSIVTITCFLRALGVGCKPSVWGHRRICSKTYAKRHRGRRARISQRPKPVLERFGWPDVVAIEADVLPAERGNVGEQLIGQSFGLAGCPPRRRYQYK